MIVCFFFFFKQKTAYEMRISDWSSDVCSSDPPAFLGGSRFSVAGVRCSFPMVPLSHGVGRNLCSVRPQARSTAEGEDGLGGARGRPERGPYCEPAQPAFCGIEPHQGDQEDRKSTRLNSSH